MSKAPLFTFAAVITTLVMVVSHAAAQPKLVRGEDLIETPAIADGLCVSNVFQSNMVLQRDKPIAIWGWAAPGEKITVRLAEQEQSTTAQNDRAWKVTFPALKATTTPLKLRVTGENESLTLDNILIGDVWVLAGQSNMEFPLSRIETGHVEIASAHFTHIRVLTVAQLPAPMPNRSFPRMYQWSGWFNRHYPQGYWDVLSPKVAYDLSAIGYVFARRIHMVTQVPIGIIDTSIGGTTVETWTPDAVMRDVDHESVKSMLAEWDQKIAKFDPQEDLIERVKRYNDRTERLKKQGKDVSTRKPPTDLQPGPAYSKNRPGNCYNGLIAPLEGLSIKGAIWHQGYNNCFNGTAGAVMYRHVFPEMIKAWRKAFGDDDMAFGILTLCTQGKKQTRDDFTAQMFDAGPYIREAQYQTFLRFHKAGDKNVGFFSSYDLDRRWYHPQLKIPAGERLARWALATQNDVTRGIEWEQAMLEKTTIEAGGIELKFDRRVSAQDNGLPMQGFAIAGEDRKFHPADAAYKVIGQDSRGRDRHDNTTVVLTSPLVPKPVAFRYAWARMPLANVRVGSGTSDVPLATMRSDDWPMEHIPLNVLGDAPPTTLDRAQRGRVQRALRQIDLDRRLFEARRLLEKHALEAPQGD